jgi:hypothetical protein
VSRHWGDDPRSSGVAIAYEESAMQRSRIPIVSAALAAVLLVASVGAVAAESTPISIPPAAAFRTAPTLTVSPDVTLLGGVLATIHVDVVCYPMPSEWDPSVDPTVGHSEGTRAQVIQAASKKAIAAGEGEGGGTFVCDGSTVNSLDIPVVSQTVPFRKGTAVIGVQLQLCNADCSGGGYRSTGPMLATLTAK